MNEREEDISGSSGKISKASSGTSTTSWSKLKDPRIVRVSRAFGGKDRHSKVCTVKGLRDRRVRLSVPTAIQLYDLQDRLGLNQPSKAVDWLLSAAKQEIDELPPLQIPQGIFCQPSSSFLDFGASSQSSAKQDLSQRSNNFWEKSKFVVSCERSEDGYVCEANVFSRQNPTSLPSFLDHSTTNYSSLVRWDPSNLSLSQPTRSQEVTDQDVNNFGFVSMASGSHQVPVHQHEMSTQSYLPLQVDAMTGFDPKQVNYQTLLLSNSALANSSLGSRTSQHVRPFHFTMAASLFPQQNNTTSDDQNKNMGFHSR